jgi:hypothetical protein
MDTSPDPAMEMQALDPLTFGDLCYAIEKGRISYDHCGSCFELRMHEIRRWGRRELAFRAMLAPLSASLSIDLGGCA